MASSSGAVVCLLLVAAALAATSSSAAARTTSSTLLPSGLSWEHYRDKCPQAEYIVSAFLADAIAEDVGLAAALLRIHFHDCFVQGCDGSVLLNRTSDTEEGKGEKEAPPNVTLRPSAFKAINDIRDLLEEECAGDDGEPVVSCADIAALAARDSVHLAGGPWYRVPLGRRDSDKFATRSVILDSLPAPSSNVSVLLDVFTKINLNVDDLVALSGAHTLGIAHCSSFDDRLYPTQDPTMDKWFAGKLKLTCPAKNVSKTTVNDIRTPDVFDNKYYVDLQNRQGLFFSDQDLYTDGQTRKIVKKFAVDQAAFFDQFVDSMVKMGQINVLTGNQGQIRRDCSVANAPGKNNAAAAAAAWSVVETVAESLVM